MFSLDKRNIRVAISPVCNFKCIYCGGNKKRDANNLGAMEDFRGKPLNEGVINVDEFVKIIKMLHISGFTGITLTGGEPLLNSRWDYMVKKLNKIGMNRIGLTTNGSLLKKYMQKNRSLPEGLSLITISLDTVDKKRFNSLTNGGDLSEIMSGLKKIREKHPKITIRANKIVLKSDLDKLQSYIEYCDKSKIINEINLLNLILKYDKDKEHFEKEFVSAPEIVKFFNTRLGYIFSMDSKYEFRARTKSGTEIILKDTNLTLRNKRCEYCPIYCQEGFFTIRVATDGTIRTCPDYSNQLSFIDGKMELKKGTLQNKINKMVEELKKTKQKNTLKVFFNKKGIKVNI